MSIQKLRMAIGGKPVESESCNYFEIYNPTTGEVQALVPKCTQKEVIAAIESAHKAFPGWASIPVMKRVQRIPRKASPS